VRKAVYSLPGTSGSGLAWGSNDDTRHDVEIYTDWFYLTSGQKAEPCFRVNDSNFKEFALYKDKDPLIVGMTFRFDDMGNRADLRGLCKLFVDTNENLIMGNKYQNLGQITGHFSVAGNLMPNEKTFVIPEDHRAMETDGSGKSPSLAANLHLFVRGADATEQIVAYKVLVTISVKL